MRTVQMTLEEDLVKTVDNIAKKLRTNRSAFTRSALREAIHRLEVAHLEKMHRKGYTLKPVNNEEFSVWEKEQRWGDK